MKRSTKEGDKIYFTCAGIPKCPRSLYILLDCGTNDADVFVSTDEHYHYSVVTLPKTIDRESKALVIELNEMGITQPSKILKELKQRNLPMLSKTQISNIKARENIKSNGKSTCDLSEWLAWINQRKSIPEDDDELYVVDYSYEFSKTDSTKIKDMRCFFTTKRLIS